MALDVWKTIKQLRVELDAVNRAVAALEKLESNAQPRQMSNPPASFSEKDPEPERRDASATPH